MVEGSKVFREYHMTALKNIEDYRLEELIFKDVSTYPESSFGEIHKRIGVEINRHKVRRLLKEMVNENKLNVEGINIY